MKIGYRHVVLITGFLLMTLTAPCNCFGQNADREEMMWRGHIMLESIEKHQMSIEPNEKLEWRHGQKDRMRIQRANIQVLAADPLNSGDVKAGGMVSVEFDSLDEFGVRPPAEKCTHGWVMNRDTEQAQASERIENNQVRITFMRASHMDAAQNIQQAIGRCGTDTNCLAKIFDQFKGVLEDTAKSFKIKMVVQLMSSCRGIIKSHSLRRSGMNCQMEDKTERDDSKELETELCRPMMFEMDGMYYRDEKGDRISAYCNDSEKTPYKAFDDQNYPREQQARCTVELSNGPPKAYIYRITEDEPPKDITDKEEKVLVGEKIKLQGEVIGTGLGEEIVKVWDVPGHLVKDWRASRKQANIVEFEADDFEGGFTNFAWVDGSPGGKRQKVEYRADYMGAEVKGKTTFIVYAPQVTWEEKKLSPTIEVEMVQTGQQNKPECELLPKSPALRLNAKVSLPREKASAQNCIQFVQLASARSWFLLPQWPGYEWYSLFFEDHLDNTYPYSGPVCGGKQSQLVIQDSPAVTLHNMNSAFEDSRFRTYLMFRPGTNDRKSVWVPLKRFDWGWKARATHTTTIHDPQQPPCHQRYLIACDKSPASYAPSEAEFPPHPTWKYAISEKDLKPLPMKGTKMYTENPLSQPPQHDDYPPWPCQ